MNFCATQTPSEQNVSSFALTTPPSKGLLLMGGERSSSGGGGNVRSGVIDMVRLWFETTSCCRNAMNDFKWNKFTGVINSIFKDIFKIFPFPS